MSQSTGTGVNETVVAVAVFKPCECKKGQFGGLPRRGTIFRQARRVHDIAIEFGNFAAGQNPLDRMPLHYTLEGLELLRYDALVPVEAESAP